MLETVFEQHMEFMAARELELAAEGIKVFRLSTTERAEFKECRRRWDLSSFSRQCLEPKKPHYALSFGTAIHYGLEIYYSGLLGGNLLSAAGAFERKWMELTIVTVYGLRGEKVPSLVQGNFIPELFQEALTKMDEFFAKDVLELLELGKAMLTNYMEWSKVGDNVASTGFTRVLYTEKEFAVPIPDPAGSPLRFKDGAGQIWELWLVGRLDMIVLDEDLLWVLDHKTSKDKLQKELLILDDQMTLYLWALKAILERWNSPYADKVAGCYYNVLRKKLPVVPRVLVNGKSLSKAKDIDTTYEIYLQAIMDNGFDPADYQDILEFIQQVPNTFFERAKVRRNQYEITNAGKLLALEAIDMLNAPYIYPHFTWDCRWKCDFKDLCLAMNRNDDVQYLLEAMFQKRKLEDGSVYLRESTIE